MLRESNWHDACLEQDEGSRYCRKVSAFDRYLRLYGENYLVSESWMLMETCSLSTKLVPGWLVAHFRVWCWLSLPGVTYGIALTSHTSSAQP